MAYMISNFIKFFKKNEADIILVIGVILISLISFGGGWLLGTSSNSTISESTKIEQIPPEELQASPTQPKTSNQSTQEEEISNQQQEIKIQQKEQEESTTDKTQQKFVASKNGSVYHYPWCPGAQQIKEENKIYFDSKEEAEKAGYRPAKNCPGL